MEDAESFDELRERSEAAGGATFVVDLDGYEGPIDVLLMLAREHKLDLTKISILALAGQYFAFIPKVGAATWCWWRSPGRGRTCCWR